MRVIKDWKTKFAKTCNFLDADLPALASKEKKIWDAFCSTAELTTQQATEAVTFNTSSPLLWFMPLGLDFGGVFNEQLPTRISLSGDIARRFEVDENNPIAQQYVRITVLHEMCHWSWFQKGKEDPDAAGEKFELVAGVKPDSSWLKAAPPKPAVDVLAPSARAKALRDALTAGIVVPPVLELFDGSDVASGMPRGIRNNNPGNIRPGENWLGLAETSRMAEFQKSETGFCVFVEPEWGLRAMAILLRNYQRLHNLKTPLEIIGRWAPASDNNNVASYASVLAKALGINASDPVDLTQNSTLITAMKALALHENGELPYDHKQFEAALQLI